MGFFPTNCCRGVLICDIVQIQLARDKQKMGCDAVQTGGCVLISFTITAFDWFFGFLLICDLLDERAPDEEAVLHSVYFILVQKREILERDRVTCIEGIAGSDYFCLFFLSPLLPLSLLVYFS